MRLFPFLIWTHSLAVILLPLSAYCEFVWPKKGEITQENLNEYAQKYAKEVETCLHVSVAARTSAQQQWCQARSTLWDEYNKVKISFQKVIESLGDIEVSRNLLCNEVKQQFVNTKHGGKQFGNCGEGAYVMYCLAHEAGYKDLMICRSSNDHVFTLFLDPKKGICLLDRWDLGAGHYFCGLFIDDVGTLYKDNPLGDFGNKWYENLECQDLLNQASSLNTREYTKKTHEFFNKLVWEQDLYQAEFQVVGKKSRKSILEALSKRYPGFEIEVVNRVRLTVIFSGNSPKNLEALLENLKNRKAVVYAAMSGNSVRASYETIDSLLGDILESKSPDKPAIDEPSKKATANPSAGAAESFR